MSKSAKMRVASMSDASTFPASSSSDDFKFKDEAAARESLSALIRALKDSSNSVSSSSSSSAAVKEEQQVVKSEPPQGSLLKAAPLDSECRPLDAAFKDSFEARSMKLEGGVERVYSLADTAGPLYLKRIQSLAEAKKTQRIVKVRDNLDPKSSR